MGGRWVGEGGGRLVGRWASRQQGMYTGGWTVHRLGWLVGHHTNVRVEMQEDGLGGSADKQTHANGQASWLDNLADWRVSRQADTC